MSGTTISPNMNLPIPIPGVEPGPDWADDIVADMNAIDSHDHSTGKGVQITPDGLNINDDLPLQSNNLTQIKTVRFTPQGTPIPATGVNVGALQVSGVDLYYNDGAGNVVRITQGGLVTGSSGTITGLPSGTASASFSGGTFTFQSATNTPATMAVGPLVIGSATVSPKTVTLAPSAAQAVNYSLTFPLVAPEANQVLISDGSGNLSWTRGLLPLGSVIATFPNLAGAYTTAATTVADANGFVKCNGQTIVDATSPMNGVVVPNINNDVFIRGNTTAGTSVSGVNSVTLSTGNLPAHTHGAGSYATSVGVTGGTAALTGTTTFAGIAHTHNFAHVHQWSHQPAGGRDQYGLSSVDDSRTDINNADPIWLNNPSTFASGAAALGGRSQTTGILDWYTTGVLSPPGGSGSSAVTAGPSLTSTVTISSTPASLTGSNTVTGTSGSTGSGTSFSILPTYITGLYLMRVK